MLCSNCKKEVKDGANFCPYCGNRMVGKDNILNSDILIDKESNAKMRQIVIAAEGEPSEVHTLLLDEKYPYHLVSGELLRIPISKESHKLTWKSPELFSSSDTMEIGANGGNIFFKVLKEKGFLGMSRYAIKKASSVKELAGFCQRERTAEPWPDGTIIDAATDSSTFACVYKKKMLVAGNDDVRTEFKFADLAFLEQNLLSLVVYNYNNLASAENCNGIVIDNLRFSDKTIKFIISQIRKMHKDGFYECAHIDDKFFLVHDDKLIVVKGNNQKEVLEYKDYVKNKKRTIPQYSNELENTGRIKHYIDNQIKNLRAKLLGEKDADIFMATTHSDTKFEFYKELDRFYICKNQKYSRPYPISGILKYEVKEFDNSNSLLASSLMITGALSGGTNSISAPLYAAQHKQKLSRIEIWLTIKETSGKTIVERVDFVHPSFAFERSSSAYGEYQAVIIKLTTYLDEVMKKLRTMSDDSPVSSLPVPPQQPNHQDTIAALREYKALLDDGIITEEEFAAKKKQLLNL